MRIPNRYATHDGPPRAARNLDEWTTEGGREDRRLDDAIGTREAEERARARAIPDVYEVADRVLAPLVEAQRTIPRRLRAVVPEALEARGVRPTRQAQLAEAGRMLAQEKAAEDPELSLALLLRAAMMFRPEGGWRRDTARPKGDGFRSVRDLLAAAFTEAEIGAGCLPLEVAQNRARTRSLPGEVFVSATRSSTSRARNATAVDRRLDAQRLIASAHVHPADVRLMFERLVLDRHQRSKGEMDRDAVVDVLRARHAHLMGIALPVRPKGDLADWRAECGKALHGDDARAGDARLMVLHEEAEMALRKAIGIGRRKPRTPRASGIAAAGYAHA